MSGERDDLWALVVDTWRWVEHLEASGLAAEVMGAPLPEGEESVEAEVEVTAAPPIAPAPDRTGIWASIAEGARAAADGARQTTVSDLMPGGAVGAVASPETLEEIRADMGDCARCKLCQKRTQIVFGVGDPQADLMVVGEGPGEQEDLRGEPFVGPAGQMLDRMLENVIGLKRSQVYIANIVKCRPPGNRNPEPDEAAVCRPFLERQILSVQPKLILVLGSVALQHLLGVTGIMKNRGKETRWRSIPALPTFHPAYLLRQPSDKPLAFEDLKLARRRYDELGGRR